MNNQLTLPLDFIFIDKTLEPLTQKIQRLIGADCFFWAKISLWISMICGALTILVCTLGIVYIFRFPSNKVEWFLLLPLVIFMHLTLLLVHWHRLFSPEHGLKKLQRSVYQMVARGEKNPLILVRRSLCLAAFWFVLLTVVEFRFPLLWILVVSVMKAPFVIGYMNECFCSCTPLPPQKSKLRSAVEVAKEKVTEAFAGGGGVPEPATT